MDNRDNPRGADENNEAQQSEFSENAPTKPLSSEEDEIVMKVQPAEETSSEKETIFEEQKELPAPEPGLSGSSSTVETAFQLEDIEVQLMNLSKQLTKLHEDFQSKIKYDEHKEKIIDKLHAELQLHKNGLLEKLLTPIFLDIIEVIDDTRKLIKDIKFQKEEGNADKLWRILNTIPGDMEDLLDKHGVEITRSLGDQFDPSVQKVVRAVPTDQEQLDKIVQERLKNGYRWQEKLLRREMVNVWQYPKKLD